MKPRDPLFEFFDIAASRLNGGRQGRFWSGRHFDSRNALNERHFHSSDGKP